VDLCGPAEYSNVLEEPAAFLDSKACFCVWERKGYEETECGCVRYLREQLWEDRLTMQHEERVLRPPARQYSSTIRSSFMGP
jgi:hypothetical protein